MNIFKYKYKKYKSKYLQLKGGSEPLVQANYAIRNSIEKLKLPWKTLTPDEEIKFKEFCKDDKTKNDIYMKLMRYWYENFKAMIKNDNEKFIVAELKLWCIHTKAKSAVIFTDDFNIEGYCPYKIKKVLDGKKDLVIDKCIEGSSIRSCFNDNFNVDADDINKQLRNCTPAKFQEKWNKFYNNDKIKKMIISVNISYPRAIKQGGGHAAIILIDKQTKIAKYFDPHALETHAITLEECGYKEVTQSLQTFIDNLGNKNKIKAEGPSDKCVSVQGLSGGAICAAWTFLIGLLWVINEGRTLEEITIKLKNLDAYTSIYLFLFYVKEKITLVSEKKKIKSDKVQKRIKLSNK